MIQLFTSPVALFRARLREHPRWAEAAAPVVACALLAAVTALVTLRRSQDALMPLLAQAGVGAVEPMAMDVVGVTSTIIGAAMMFGLTTGAVLMLDGLFAQSGHGRRLVEFSAAAHLVQVPWAALMVLFAIWVIEPPPIHVPNGALSLADMRGSLERYQVASVSTPLQLTLRLIGAFFALWVVALQACALRAVSGFSVRGTWAAGLALGTLFVILPWAWQRFA